MDLILVFVVFISIAFPVYLFLMCFSVSREERRKQRHFDDAMKHPGRRL